ncbi:MAG: hypothetical protein ABSB42_02075 [Tepidisphaeraceae bacterium]|jgi:HlyD family secretion protein
MNSVAVFGRGWGRLAMVCGVGAAVWLASGLRGAADPPSTAPTTNVSAGQANAGKTTVVRRGDLRLDLDFKGVFEPAGPFAVRLNPRLFHDELIIKHAIADGTKVSRGDVLLELETDKIDAAIAAAANDLRIAQANLTKAQADANLDQQSDGVAMADAKEQLVDAQTELKRWDDVDGQILSLMRSMNARTADFRVESAQDELNELRKMYKSEDLTNETADIVMKRAVRELDLETQFSKVNHGELDRYTQFEAPVQREQMSNNVNVQTVGIAQLGASQTQARELRQTSLVAARAAADETQKHLDLLKRDRGFFTVSSAIDGVVVYGNFDHQAWHAIEPDVLAPGQKAQADQVLLTVYSPGKLRLAAQCPENEVGYFRPGTKVSVAPVAMPDLTYDGICEPPPVVTEAQGPQQIFNVVVDLPTVDPRLAPGFSADVNLSAGLHKGVLLVPATAVWRGKVWTSPPGSNEEEARRVVTGASDGQDVEIKSGLAEGDTVLTQAKRPGGGQ